MEYPKRENYDSETEYYFAVENWKKTIQAKSVVGYVIGIGIVGFLAVVILIIGACIR